MLPLASAQSDLAPLTPPGYDGAGYDGTVEARRPSVRPTAPPLPLPHDEALPPQPPTLPPLDASYQYVPPSPDTATVTAARPRTAGKSPGKLRRLVQWLRRRGPAAGGNQ